MRYETVRIHRQQNGEMITFIHTGLVTIADEHWKD
jgi:hypothetical protein